MTVHSSLTSGNVVETYLGPSDKGYNSDAAVEISFG